MSAPTSTPRTAAAGSDSKQQNFWLHQQRIARAQELLERTDVSVEQIAVSCGLGTAATLRRHLHRAVGVSPTAYRATFQLA